MSVANQHGVSQFQPAAIRPSIVLVPLDTFGERVAATVIETVLATEPARAESCRVVSVDAALDGTTLISALLAAEQAAGNGGARILTWLIGDLAADDTSTLLERTEAALGLLAGAVAPYRLQIDARCFWQVGPLLAREAALARALASSGADAPADKATVDKATSDDAAAAERPAPPRTLHNALELLTDLDTHESTSELLSFGHWLVAGVGPNGPVVSSVTDLVEACAVALEAVALTDHWPDLTIHPFFRCEVGGHPDRLVGFAARLAYHPADEIARWVGERIVAERLNTFATPAHDENAEAVPLSLSPGGAETKPPSFADTFEVVRLGSTDERSGPKSPVVPTPWLASRASLTRRLDLTMIELRAGLTRWRLAVGDTVAAETARLGAAGVSATAAALSRVRATVDAALKENEGGLHHALVVATEAEQALQEQEKLEASRLPHFPAPHPWTLAPVDEAHQQLRAEIARQAEPLALLLYSLASMALLMLAAWQPLTRIYADGRGPLYALGVPLVVVVTLAAGLGPISRFFLRRKLGPLGPLVVKTTAVEGQLGTDARSMLGALSARGRLRAVRRAAALTREDRHQLALVLTLARSRVDALQSGPMTAGAFAGTLLGRSQKARAPLLTAEDTMKLASDTLQHYRTMFVAAPVAMTVPGATPSGQFAAWYGPSAPETLTAYEAHVLDVCRQITANGPKLTVDGMQSVTRDLESRLEPLAPLEAGALGRGATAMVLPTAHEDAGQLTGTQATASELASAVHAVSPHTHIGVLASPNKLYALTLWAGLAPTDLVNTPLRESDAPPPDGRARPRARGGAS